MSDDSLDTRSLRREALTMLKSGEAINKTLKWTMRTKMQTSPCKKVYLDVPSTMNNSHSAPNLQSKPSSPISTPNLDRAMLTHRGISHEPSAYAQSTLVEASASIMALKGNIVPMHFVKDAMVDVIRKEKLLLRNKGTVADNSLYLTDDISTSSHLELNDSWSSIQGLAKPPQESFMDTTQAKMVSRLANPKEESSYRWKQMKKIRDERNATLERRKAREDMIYNFKRVVHNTEQNEFHRAYREQYAQQEHLVKKVHQDRARERKLLDESMNKKIANKKKLQQDEGRYMRAMLRESAELARASLHEEVVFNKINNELSGTFRSQVSLDISSSSQVQIPDHLHHKLKNAKSLGAFTAAQKEIKDYYESSMSDRIAVYAKSRERAITRASETDHPISLSPIRGSDLFYDSLPSTAPYHEEFDRYVHHSQHVRPPEPMRHTSASYSPSAETTSRGRPSTSDIAMREYFASRVAQQEQFELENFSLHSQDDVSMSQYQQISRIM